MTAELANIYTDRFVGHRIFLYVVFYTFFIYTYSCICSGGHAIKSRPGENDCNARSNKSGFGTYNARKYKKKKKKTKYKTPVETMCGGNVRTFYVKKFTARVFFFFGISFSKISVRRTKILEIKYTNVNTARSKHNKTTESCNWICFIYLFIFNLAKKQFRY